MALTVKCNVLTNKRARVVYNESRMRVLIPTNIATSSYVTMVCYSLLAGQMKVITRFVNTDDRYAANQLVKPEPLRMRLTWLFLRFRQVSVFTLTCFACHGHNNCHNGNLGNHRKRTSSKGWKFWQSGNGTLCKYRLYSIERPGRLLNFWILKVGAYLRLGLINFHYLQGGRLFEDAARLRPNKYGA